MFFNHMQSIKSLQKSCKLTVHPLRVSSCQTLLFKSRLCLCFKMHMLKLSTCSTLRKYVASKNHNLKIKAYSKQNQIQVCQDCHVRSCLIKRLRKTKALRLWILGRRNRRKESIFVTNHKNLRQNTTL